MTKSDPNTNDFECLNENCGEWFSVRLPYEKYVTCPWCKTKHEIHPDAEFIEGMWHDRTELSIVEPEREHIQRMIDHAKKHEH